MKNLCLVGVLFCAVSAIAQKVANGQIPRIEHGQQDDFRKFKVNLISGTEKGNVSIHAVLYGSSAVDIDNDAFKLNSSKAIAAVARNESHLIVAKEGDGIYVGRFNFRYLAYRLPDAQPKKLKAEASKVSDMVVVNNTLYFVSRNGSVGYCNLVKGACGELKQVSTKKYDYTGISYDPRRSEFYVAVNNGSLHRCSLAVGWGTKPYNSYSSKYSQKYNGANQAYQPYSSQGSQGFRSRRSANTKTQNYGHYDDYGNGADNSYLYQKYYQNSQSKYGYGGSGGVQKFGQQSGGFKNTPASGSQPTFNCTSVYEHTTDGFFNGFESVHVAFNAVWLGTRYSRVLKCPLAQRKNKLICEPFVEFGWLNLVSQPTADSIASNRNGQLFARVKGAGSNRILQCDDPNMPKSCKVFKLPDGTKSILVV